MKYLMSILFYIVSVTTVLSQELNIVLSSDSDGHTVAARIFGKYLTKNISQETTPVFRVVPGAAGVNSTNYLYNVASKDGNTIGIVFRNIPIIGAIGGQNIQFDATKFNWLGSLSDGRLDASVLLSNKLPSSDDEILIGSENVVAASPIDFIIKNTDLKARKISGYKSSNDVRLAFLRNEVNAIVTTLLGVTTYDPDWLKRYHVVYQFGNGSNRHEMIPNTPTLIDNLNNHNARLLLNMMEQQFALIRPYIAPPNIPPAKLTQLRNAFNAAVNDPEFIKEASRIQLVVTPILHEEATQIVNNTYNTPRELLETLK